MLSSISIDRVALSAILRSAPGRWGMALLAVGLWYVLAEWLSGTALGVAPGRDAWSCDLSMHLLLGALLFGMARSLRRFVVAMAVLFSAFTLGNALKLAVLGGPLMPDDFIAARNLFLLLEGWQFWGSVAMLVVPLALLLWMFAWRQPCAWATAACVVAGFFVLGAQAPALSGWLDARFGDWVWNQRGNYEMRGLPLHLLQESVRNLARREQAPDPGEVGAALASLGLEAPGYLMKSDGQARAPRNVHMIVLESFWDAARLDAAGLSENPLDPTFRKLWAKAGRSHALSPVFGGYTANAEFEALCGFPVRHDAVFFEGRLRRDVPCLPHHLGEAGYLSVASHPNAAPFWNRINAYRRVGFDTYWSERDFVLDDMNREFLSDSSLYRQVLERIEPLLDGSQPVFNYVLTYFGHLDYPLNDARPPRITAASGDTTVEAYANTVYYKSRELMAFLAELRRRDPDAVIVAFGDHLPSLGMNYGGYAESGLLTRDRAAFTDRMFHTLVATPLVVIDGKRGPVATGDLPVYALPALILSLLGDERESVLNMPVAAAGGQRIRPLPGVHFTLADKGRKSVFTVCRDGEDLPACEESRAWLQAVAVLERDLFSGHQHVLNAPPPVLHTADADAVDDVLPAGQTHVIN